MDPFGGDPEDYAVLHFVEHTCSASLECVNVAAAPLAPQAKLEAKVEKEKMVCASKVLSLFNQDYKGGAGAGGAGAPAAASGKAGVPNKTASIFGAASGAAPPSLPAEGGETAANGAFQGGIVELDGLVSPTRTELSSVLDSHSSSLLGISTKASRSQTMGGAIRHDSEVNPKAALLMSMKGAAPGLKHEGYKQESMRPRTPEIRSSSRGGGGDRRQSTGGRQSPAPGLSHSSQKSDGGGGGRNGSRSRAERESSRADFKHERASTPQPRGEHPGREREQGAGSPNAHSPNSRANSRPGSPTKFPAGGSGSLTTMSVFARAGPSAAAGGGGGGGGGGGVGSSEYRKTAVSAAVRHQSNAGISAGKERDRRSASSKDFSA